MITNNSCEMAILGGVNYLPSPFCDDRPPQTDVELLVIHNISLPPGQFGQGHIQRFFKGELETDLHPYFQTIKDLKVSSHLLIDRTGEVFQFVPFNKRAWHAGQSVFKGREQCNDFSIGIELEGTDFEPFEDVQYRVLAEITLLLMDKYPAISLDNIVGHSHIAPNRKTDPGPFFDWSYFHCVLQR